MVCHFCSNNEHSSENCKIYPTLESRYSKLNYCFKPCLCENLHDRFERHNSIFCVNSCECKNFCDICLQQHHIALCPKRDPNHEFYSKSFPEPLNLLSLDYLTLQRFLTLCNPIDKIKMHLTCKYLNHLQPLNYKLSIESGMFSCFSQNLIYIDSAYFQCNIIYNNIQSIKDPNLNVQKFEMDNVNIKKTDMQIMSKNDPYFIELRNGEFEKDFSFRDFLNEFPFVIKFEFVAQSLPFTWITDLIEAKRFVSLRFIHFYLPRTILRIDADELVKLFETHKKLKIRIDVNFYSYSEEKIKKLMMHERFSVTSYTEEWCIAFNRDVTEQVRRGMDIVYHSFHFSIS